MVHSNHTITVLSKSGCHLCETAIKTLMEISRDKNLVVRIVDIQSDQHLFLRYFLEIPVIQLDGRDVFKAEDLALKSDCERNVRNLVQGLN